MLYQQYKVFIPKRLADQIGGNIDSYSFNLSAFVLNELQKRGVIDKPTGESVFTKNLFLIRS